MNDDEYFPKDDPRNVFISPHNRYTPAFLHRHSFFEIAYVYSGHCQQTIGLGRKEFHSGDMIFIAPDVYHTMEVFDDASLIVNMLIAMSARLMRNFQDSLESSYSREDVQKDEGFLVLDYIQKHLKDVNLSEVAEHFGFSLSHCSRLIKKTTGLGFNEWRRSLRIRRAENMLVNTDLTVGEISLELGYENTETFIRAFKKNLHVTPGKYREENSGRGN